MKQNRKNPLVILAFSFFLYVWYSLEKFLKEHASLGSAALCSLPAKQQINAQYRITVKQKCNTARAQVLDLQQINSLLSPFFFPPKATNVFFPSFSNTRHKTVFCYG